RALAVREAAARAKRPIGLLFDLQGPKLRLADGIAERALGPGEDVIFGPGGVPVDFAAFARLVTPRSEIVIGDGVPRLSVVAVDGEDVRARAVSPGPLL